MSIKPEQVITQIQAQAAALGKSQLESAHQLLSAQLTAAERLAALNLETARGVLQHFSAQVKAVLGAKDAQELLGLQAASFQPALEQVAGYARNVYEIATQTQAVATKTAEANLAHVTKLADQAVEQALASAPAGSDAAVSAIKNAIAGAHTAFETIQKAAKDVQQMTEANVAAATEATIKAVGAAAPKLKRVA